MSKQKKELVLPSIQELEEEISRQKRRQSQGNMLRSILYALITVAAVTALIAILFTPVLRTYGASMSPTLEDGELVIVLKTDKAQPGDVIAFYYNNKLFIKRVVALGGSEVDIDGDGNVYVDGELLDEPYLAAKAAGSGDVEFPYRVPAGRYFVLGDNRISSADSRSSIFGCVDPDDMLGRVFACVWPLDHFGTIQ